eukprot:GHVU01093737.1.p1 GENE.GHVU01093737.1~~GHVU01093737.1.p1  ORF type:complete len:163 (+),score=3.77 GHVU01093737.1:23-511(+)
MKLFWSPDPDPAASPDPCTGGSATRGAWSLPTGWGGTSTATVDLGDLDRGRPRETIFYSGFRLPIARYNLLPRQKQVSRGDFILTQGALPRWLLDFLSFKDRCFQSRLGSTSHPGCLVVATHSSGNFPQSQNISEKASIAADTSTSSKSDTRRLVLDFGTAA